MHFRRLGNSGLHISEICFGAMSFTGTKGGWNHIARTGQEEATKLTRFALDSGINFFDTADIYSNGRSEEMLGIASREEGMRLLSQRNAVSEWKRVPTATAFHVGAFSKPVMRACAG